jgi:hypothetical protein
MGAAPRLATVTHSSTITILHPDGSRVKRWTAGEAASRPPLQKARFNEVLQQSPAHLPVEACHVRGAGGGERCAGLREQIPDSRERFFDTSCLEQLRHVCWLATASSDRAIR